MDQRLDDRPCHGRLSGAIGRLRNGPYRMAVCRRNDFLFSFSGAASIQQSFGRLAPRYLGNFRLTNTDSRMAPPSHNPVSAFEKLICRAEGPHLADLRRMRAPGRRSDYPSLRRSARKRSYHASLISSANGSNAGCRMVNARAFGARTNSRTDRTVASNRATRSS